MPLPTIDEIRTAQQLVYAVMPPTPQIVWPLLCERLGAEVWVKHENHTPIGAFKARTAIVYAAELFRESNSIKGLVTATRGMMTVNAVPTPTSDTSLTEMRAFGLAFLRSWISCARSSIE